jgi:hypothetical protein
MHTLNAIAPVVESAQIVASTVVVTVGGLGAPGLIATIGAQGFEVLGERIKQEVVYWSHERAA